MMVPIQFLVPDMARRVSWMGRVPPTAAGELYGLVDTRQEWEEKGTAAGSSRPALPGRVGRRWRSMEGGFDTQEYPEQKEERIAGVSFPSVDEMVEGMRHSTETRRATDELLRRTGGASAL
jgi:hypothetical protein